MNWFKQSIQNAPNEALIQDRLDNMPNAGLSEIHKVLQSYNIDFDMIDFPEQKLIVANFNNQKYIIDDFEFPTIKQAGEWVWELKDSQLSSLMPWPDFVEDFWENLGNGFKVYHATKNENVANIIQNGLKVMNKTRGLSNRGTGSAIFTSDNPGDIGSYGDTIFEIDVAAMKTSGYRPVVSSEEPIQEATLREAVAHKIGLEDFCADESLGSEGIYKTTIIFYNDIPSKYLRIFKDEI